MWIFIGQNIGREYNTHSVTQQGKMFVVLRRENMKDGKTSIENYGFAIIRRYYRLGSLFADAPSCLGGQNSQIMPVLTKEEHEGNLKV